MEWLGRLLGVPAPGTGGEPDGYPVPWQVWHQNPATTLMEQIDALHGLMFWIMVGICLLVIGLGAYVVFRFHESRHPIPSRTTHNTLLEVAWTVAPVIILVIIAVPSFRALYYMHQIPPDVEMTLKVTGRQWYWDYEYPDHEGVSFSSYMVPDEQIAPDGRRILDVDEPVVLPVDTNIRLIVTAGDVLHNWTIPSFGVKLDAVPGRLNETWIRITRPGTYYGQCSELCGTGHPYMPAAVQAVPKEQFNKWIAGRRTAAAPGGSSTRLAGAAPAAASPSAPAR